MKFPDKITVVDVSPRDGLQSLPKWIPTETKVKMIDRLSQAGYPVIEVSGFGSERALPMLKDAEAVFEQIQRRPGVIYRGLAPNAYGAKRAVNAKADEIIGLTVVSPTYLKKNQNMDPQKAIDEAIQAFRTADEHGCSYVVALGMSFWCPYEGLIPEEAVIDTVRQFRNGGIRKMYLAGSVGMEDPRHVNTLFAKLGDQFPDVELGFHVHNLSGMGSANILAALDAGAAWLEGATCGIGGGIAMPSSLGSVGNYASEDLVRLMDVCGIKTDVSPDDALAAARDVAQLLDIEARSHSMLGCTRENIKKAPPSQM